MRFAVLTTLALVLSACDPSAKTPQGPAGDVARQAAAVVAPGADVADQPFEDLVAQLDLRKTYTARADEITEQIRKTRAAVATAARRPSAATGGPRLASVVRSAGTFSVPLFAIDFAESLDDLTKKGGSRELKSDPYTSTEDGSTTTTRTTLTVTETFTASGARVTARVVWSYKTTTVDKATSATLVDMTDERTLNGAIDVCPDAAGDVPGSLDTRSALVARTTAGTTTRTSTGTSTFRGSVDDQAALRSVAQQNKVEASWESSSGNGSYSASQSATWNASGAGEYLGGLDAGSLNASVTTGGNASAADAAKSAGWDMALSAYALEPSYKKAQELWRHGRCVVVDAPDYSAETPIEVSAQEKSQHQEDVDAGSETKFAVRLKHRFAGGALSQPTAAAITSGEKKLEPTKLDASGGSLTYTAPDDVDKSATLQLRSTSKRGIGTLVLTFRTADAALAVSATGTVRLDTGFLLTYDGKITIGPIVLKKDGPSYAGHGPMHMDMRTEPLPGCPLTFVIDGDVALSATLEKRGNDSVWVIRPDPAKSGGESTTSNVGCLGQSTSSFNPPGGGYGTMFFQAAGDVVIPKDGGTVNVRGTRPVAGTVSFIVEGTATGTLERKK